MNSRRTPTVWLYVSNTSSIYIARTVHERRRRQHIVVTRCAYVFFILKPIRRNIDCRQTIITACRYIEHVHAESIGALQILAEILAGCQVNYIVLHYNASRVLMQDYCVLGLHDHVTPACDVRVELASRLATCNVQTVHFDAPCAPETLNTELVTSIPQISCPIQDFVLPTTGNQQLCYGSVIEALRLPVPQPDVKKKLILKFI